MRRKSLILMLLLTLTMVTIVFVRLIIKRDTLETQKERLIFFTDYLDIQFNFVLNTYQQSANIAFFEFKNDQNIKPLLDGYISSGTKGDSLYEQKINEQVKPMSERFVGNGVSKICFSLYYKDSNHPKSDIQNCSCFSDYQLIANSKEGLSVDGFSICGNDIGYKFVYPCYSSNKSLIGFFEVSYDYHLIRNLISSVVNNNNIGFIYIPNKLAFIGNKIQTQEFQNCSLCPNLYIVHDFILPAELKDNKNIRNLILKTIGEENETNLHKKFSVYLNTHNNVSVLTFRELELLDNTGRIFIVSVNHDYVLVKTKQLNDAIFIINMIIIFLGMFGITYLYLNRLTIIQQKLSIQKSEKKLVELNESKDKFFSIVAHDLKNPFNGIMGMSGYLTMEYDNIDDDEKKEIIDDINISSKNAFNLLQNLLEWTRTQSGTIKNVPVIIEPVKTIEFSLETVTNLAKIKQIEIKKTIVTKAFGWADENLVSTVIRNLSTNAIKFSPRGSTVEILVKDFADDLVFCVIDNGLGMRDDEIDKLFRIDLNFHKLGTEKEIGSGIGLKLCKEFVEYCGGMIWVISEPGKGSSFYFTIPKYKIQSTTFQN